MARRSETRTPGPEDKPCAACPYGPPDWRYRCRACGHEFKMPAPTGPSDEKGRSCPACRTGDIERIDIAKSEACPPGG